MFGNLGTGEIVLILLIILIFFGSKKIPELAQGLGKGIKEFRKAAREMHEDEAHPDESKKIEKK
jgi:sec-independent protein translocase protein TatA